MRLATRLSLSYIGFVTLLAVLVLILAGIQLARLAQFSSSMPVPASSKDAMAIARHLSGAGLGADIPQQYLRMTLNVGGWAQVLDAHGREVQAVSTPAGWKQEFTAAELAALGQSDNGWYIEIRPVIEGAVVRGAVILAAPNGSMLGIRLPNAMTRAFWNYFLTGVGMAVLTAVALALGAGFLYARRLARPLVRLSRELEVAAAGDFTHRIPADGKDEFAVLARAYNNLVARLAAAEEQRNRLDQARRDLVANISHDLRTPLTAIQGFTEIMAADETTPETRKETATKVALRIAALDGMLSDLLELSRLQALPAVKREPVDLPELIREQVIGVMPELEQAGLEVDVDLPSDLPQVPLDGRLIARALQNLLVNAVRHSGGARHLAVGLMRSGPGVTITVADDGRGIPAAELPMLFERYYRGTSATNLKRGTGLGLAIVKQIAENHGGQIAVETAEGRGTTFKLWLPLSG